MPIEELPDGGVRINMQCPVADCGHRFVTVWHPPIKPTKGKASFNGIPLGEGTLKVPPPFTKLNSITFQAMRKHFQEAHKP